MILSALKGLLMASELPTAEEMVPSFLHALMWACLFGAVDAVIASKPWPVWAVALGLSLGSLIVGAKWPQIKPKVGPRFASGLERIASNRLYRWAIYSAIVIALLVSTYHHYRGGAQQIVHHTNTSVVVAEPPKVESPKPQSKSDTHKLPPAVPNKLTVQAPTRDSNEDLCRSASIEAEKIRKFQSEYEDAERSVEQKYYALGPKAANHDEETKLWANRQQETLQLLQAHESRFRGEFMGTAKYISDSILDRLPSEKRASILVNNNQAESNLNAGQLIGAFNEYGIATYLDVLSKALCSVKEAAK